MPIGTVDYVSTQPWNSPINPWPAYAAVKIEQYDAEDALIFSDTLTLSAFDPVTDSLDIGGTRLNMIYGYITEAATVLLVYGLSADVGAGNIYYNCWTYSNQTTLTVGIKGDSSRAIPTKSLGDATGWFNLLGDMAKVTITPVYDALNPWEFRRRRLLELC
jgi:hypothetical protein